MLWFVGGIQGLVHGRSDNLWPLSLWNEEGQALGPAILPRTSPEIHS